MVDTCKLNLNDVTINAGCNIMVVPSAYEHNSQTKVNDNDLFVDDRGEIVTGQRAFINDKYFNLTILPKLNCETSPAETTSRWQIIKKDYQKAKTAGKITSTEIKTFRHKFEPEKFNSKIFVQFSFPRFNKSTNFKSVSMTQQKDILFDIEDRLRSLGIQTNIWKSDISRLDTFANINTDNPFNNYTPVFDLVKASRKKSMEWNGETYLWKSGEHQISVYDKIKEILSRHNDEKIIKKFQGLNVLRIENRFSTKRKFLSKFGFTNISTLFEDYGYLKEVFKKDISQSIFKYESNDIELLTGESIKSELQNFYNSGRRYWFRQFLIYTGYLSLIKLASPEMILQAIDEMEISGSSSKVRVIKHRIKKTFDEAKTGYMLSQSDYFKNLKSYKELYSELKQKFLKQVA